MIAGLTLSPASATLAAGAKVTFTPQGWNAGSNTPVVTPVTWTATGGTITSAGVYTAGSVPGNYEVVAASTTTNKTERAPITITGTAATISSIDLTPATVSLATGATRQFSVSARLSNGSTQANPPVSWSATGGTISGAGLYTAGTTAGNYLVIARTANGKADSSKVALTKTTATLTGLVLSPASVSLTSGATRQFTVTATWSNGTTTVPPLTYSATGGTITASGLYTAGSAAGTFRVIARHAEGTRADTSAITITPPAGGVSECATPRSGWIWCDDFEANRLSSYFEYDNAGGRFTRNASVGKDGSTGMKAIYTTAPATSSGALHLAFGKVPSSSFRPVDGGTAVYREIYWRVWVRNQNGWVGGAGDKLSRATSFAGSDWSQAMIAHVWGTKNSVDLVTDPASGTNTAGQLITHGYNDFANLRWLGLKRGKTPLFDAAHVGQWYCVEAHARLNDAGQSNGVFEFWVNGNSEAVTSGLNWLGNYSSYGINAVFLENYWNDGSPVQQERYMDNFVVSTQRIGC